MQCSRRCRASCAVCVCIIIYGLQWQPGAAAAATAQWTRRPKGVDGGRRPQIVSSGRRMESVGCIWYACIAFCAHEITFTGDGYYCKNMHISAASQNQRRPGISGCPVAHTHDTRTNRLNKCKIVCMLNTDTI